MRPCDAREVAQKPARQIDEVHALIDQFTTARDGRIGAPLALVAGPAAMSVAAANKDQRADGARIEDSRALRKAR